MWAVFNVELICARTESFVSKNANLGGDLVSRMANWFPFLNSSNKLALTYEYPQVSKLKLKKRAFEGFQVFNFGWDVCYKKGWGFWTITKLHLVKWRSRQRCLLPLNWNKIKSRENHFLRFEMCFKLVLRCNTFIALAQDDVDW